MGLYDEMHKAADEAEITAEGVNAVQIGGEHYRSEYQHWDFIELNGIGYLEAAATKYVIRWRKKNGREDLEKAMHYLDKLEELHTQGRRLPRGVASLADVQRFADANNLSEMEQVVVHDLSRWDCVNDLRHARSAILRLLDEADNMHPPSIMQERPFGFDKEQDVDSEQR